MILALQSPAGPALEPTAKNQQWLGDSDYPASNGDASNGGVVTVKIVIAPNGIPETCAVVSSSGNTTINKLVCDLSLKRLRFKAPLSMSGIPTYAIWQRRAVLLPPGMTVKPEQPTSFNMRLAPSALAKKNSYLRLIVSVDEAGNDVGCTASDKKSPSALIDLACAEVKSTWQSAPEVNGAGTAIPYIRWAIVKFEDA